MRSAAAKDAGRNPAEVCSSMSRHPWAKGSPVPEQAQLMERVVERSNMQRAYSRVKQNKGAPGVDGMSVKQLGGFLRAHWPVIKERLLEGSYKPKPVKRVAIPKTSGGLRPLGIPTVLDMDLAQFFDEVNHEKLMAKMGRKVKDWRVKKLIRRYLRAGVLSGGVVSVQQKGTPQGGPLSPLLSNIVLDELDKELERRGHSFCRYADDCNIYVGSRKSGERVMASITRFVEQQLKLRVNLNKSAVARPWQRKFLGYSFSWHRKARMRVAKASIKRFKSNLKVLFRKGRGRNLQRFIQQDLNPVIRGWINYFRLSEFAGFAEQLDQWLRRHLRCILWRQWKRPWKRFQRLLKLGLSEERAARSAFNQRGPWFNAGASHMNQALPRRYFDQFGLICMLQTLRRLGPVLT
jgi:RNA-directed DNA polymerase